MSAIDEADRKGKQESSSRSWNSPATSKKPEEVIVAGGDPDSEIEAGDQLGMKTVRFTAGNKFRNRGQECDHYVNTSAELRSAVPSSVSDRRVFRVHRCLAGDSEITTCHEACAAPPHSCPYLNTTAERLVWARNESSAASALAGEAGTASPFGPVARDIAFIADTGVLLGPGLSAHLAVSSSKSTATLPRRRYPGGAVEGAPEGCH